MPGESEHFSSRNMGSSNGPRKMEPVTLVDKTALALFSEEKIQYTH
jgi:hypothetical protein